jgi:hypothetical protein
MMKNSKFIQKFKNSSLKNKIKTISLSVVMLAAVGLTVHKLSILETGAIFTSGDESNVTLTVTNEVYNSLITQMQSNMITNIMDNGDIDTTTQRSVPEDVYAEEY